jgi:NAD(P)-dependent dehydrogenase (short-subunit alcohol dehydrogenase family)
VTGEGRVALVTGAEDGIRAATVESLTAAGWAVAPATAREREIAVDLTDGAELVGLVTDRLGRLDLVATCPAESALAGVDVHPVDDWWRILDRNLGGPFRLVRAAAPHLAERGGSIVFVSSEWGVTGWPGATAYSASMAGLIGMTKALSRELAPDVRVNAVAAGLVDTPRSAVDAAAGGISVADTMARYAESVPLRRMGSPRDIAATILFLASDGASFYTGQVLSPNGGRTRV